MAPKVPKEGDDTGSAQPLRAHDYTVSKVNINVTLPDLKIKEHDRRDPPSTLPRPPFMCGVFGSRGSGKTTFTINLMRLYDAMKCFDKIWFFSPTHKKDPKFEALVESKLFAKLELFETYNDSKFEEILKEMDSSLDDYDKYKVALEAYKKFAAGKSIDSLPPEELLALYQYDFNNPEESGRYKYGRPSYLIVFDDMVGDKSVYRGDSSSRVGRFALRHRHYSCSVCFLSQAYRNGIPRQLRNNLSFAIFFANKSDRIKAEVAEEMSSFISPDQFIELWTFATQDPHDSFVIDFDAAKPEYRFRKNLDLLLVPGHNRQTDMAGPSKQEVKMEPDEDE